MYIDSDEGRNELQILMNSIISKKLMDNFNSAINKCDLTNSEVSNNFSRSHNALNKIINQGENLKTGTFLRIVSTANNIMNKDDLPIVIDDLINNDIEFTIDLANKVPFQKASHLIPNNITIFKSLNVYKVLLAKRTDQFKEDFLELTSRQGGHNNGC